MKCEIAPSQKLIPWASFYAASMETYAAHNLSSSPVSAIPNPDAQQAIRVVTSQTSPITAGFERDLLSKIKKKKGLSSSLGKATSPLKKDDLEKKGLFGKLGLSKKGK